ncbi:MULTISPECIES: GntR family transcriptional regulator [Pontibacillus]|uniref:GntR family transcriptional regulator n=1 Tax=Pontibacillus chungwhensis TaxID=265426 RepID=A0ABY8UWU5_9BACI|nr:MULTISPECIES: GntR family transcriptional regulator [Pontibacillus]MCD5325219.1 GntR family transcriptional regulator [Pontibacillus sp. HN14]WIF97467.1 GntR family transcriptional regulator [Pontibacillus chungwhensis]
MTQRQNRVPYYLQVKHSIIENIKNQSWKPGEKIPSENQLMQEYQVSRSTIRQAITQLAQEGILETKRGKSTTVKKKPSDHVKNPGVIQREKGTEFSVQIIRNVHGKKMDYAKKMLGLSEEQAVYMYERLRLADGVPIAFQQLFIPEHIVESLTDEDLLVFDFHAHLEEKGMQPNYSKEYVSASLANTYEADFLGIVAGDPLVDMTRITLGIDQSPLEYCRTKYLPTFFDFTVETRG